jgi:hypothetical protein
MEQIYDVALQVQAFDRSHPGVYAMGGGAGMAGYLLGDPLFQTEGLMMDPGYLLHIRHQDDLLATLRTYGVRYYSAWESRDPAVFSKRHDGKCFLAEEPDDVTGPDTLHMHATLCGPPVATILADKVMNHIYDLNQQGGR